ncbi:MAG: radical SAM protein [Chloroflexi bacterium]|nr:radical SAM protein [Chloroflexota bacterium]
MHLYTHRLDGTGQVLIYRPLLGLAFVGNAAMAELCQRVATGGNNAQLNVEGEAMRFLSSIGFLRADPPPPPRTMESFRPILAVLLTTNRCQLRCVYCYAAAGAQPEMDLPEELGRQAIDLVCANARGNKKTRAFEVSFHGGGEPSLAWKTMQACTAYARQKPLPARITLTSNGVWSQRQCEWIVSNLDGVSLSMDGRPETQNGHRPFASGKESFGAVWRNITEMDRRGFEYSIRLTATEPWDGFPQEIEFLCRETGCQSFHVEPTFHIQRGAHGDALPGEGQAFVDAFLEAAEIAGKAGRRLEYSGARIGLLLDTFCTAPFQALIVNPLGQLVACYELAGQSHPMNDISTVGYLKDGRILLDGKMRRKLHDLLGARRESCKDCFCYWSCAGDCYIRSFSSSGDDPAKRGERCQINRKLTEALILKKIAEGNGVCGLTNQRAEAEMAHDPYWGMHP